MCLAGQLYLNTDVGGKYPVLCRAHVLLIFCHMNFIWPIYNYSSTLYKQKVFTSLCLGPSCFIQSQRLNHWMLQCTYLNKAQWLVMESEPILHMCILVQDTN